jgi:hypothetical protein
LYGQVPNRSSLVSAILAVGVRQVGVTIVRTSRFDN